MLPRVQKESKVTSVIFVIPYTAPRFSTIAAAMGRGTISQRWLRDDHSTGADKTMTEHGKGPIGDAADKLLLTLREGKTQAAEAIFLECSSTVNEKGEENVCPLGLYSCILIDIPFADGVRV
jgi:hypothetical protein